MTRKRRKSWRRWKCVGGRCDRETRGEGGEEEEDKEEEEEGGKEEENGKGKEKRRIRI